MDFIDLKTQQALIRKDIDDAIAKVLDHGQYILGPEVSELEALLCGFTGAKHTIGVSSGTDSLLMALMALGVGPGDEVITVAYTWISSAEVIALVGAKPVFVDIEEDTWNMNPDLLEAAITENTKAIIPVGIYGQTANMATINKIADRNGSIPVVEDAAQSFGATHHSQMSGNLSLVGSTSFFPSKPLGGYGDAGALFTDDDELAEKFKWIRVHGQQKKHYHPVVGLNARLDSIQAAVLIPKLELFKKEVILRREIGEQYTELLAGLDDIVCPGIASFNTSVYAQYTILCENRDIIGDALKADGIPSVAYYAVPLHLQPVFEELGYQKGDFPVTESVADRCLSLPMSPYLSDSDLNRVASAIKQAVR